MIRLEQSLLALKVFGGIAKTKIPFAIPEDETKLDELELIFNREHENIGDDDLEQEAAELLARYHQESKKQKIKELNAELEDLDENSDDYEKILKEIYELQNNQE